jgi:hypothetical protein
VVDYTRRAFLDWLRLRAQTPLLRLSSAQAVKQRLRLLDSDPASGLIAAYIDGADHPNSPHSSVLYALNVSAETQMLVASLPASPAAISGWRLHPALAEGVDARAREATLRSEHRGAPDSLGGSTRVWLEIPARTAVVWVQTPTSG